MSIPENGRVEPEMSAKPERSDAWQRLNSESFDLLVIGGGINGAGIVRDAALRGLNVALVEKGDFGSGTSFRSSKLIHGGLRYLETYQFGLVRESTAERAVQMRVAPHLSRPLPFLFPVYKGDPHGLLFMDMGLWLYDALALFRVPKIHRAMRERGVLAKEKDLKKEGLVGGLHYFDCSADDGRLTLENVLDAESLGGVCLNYARVDKLNRSSDGSRVVGAKVTDLVGESTAEVHAKMIISATGAWTDSFLEGAGESREKLVRATRGSHVVVRKEKFPIQNAVTMLSPTDQRPLFVIPWGDHTYVGTTDVDHSEGPDRVFITRDEVDYILETVSHYFPSLNISVDDITGTWSGLRPLVDEPGVESNVKVSREHEIFGGEDGLMILAGGKLTTYRLMAKQTLDEALGHLAQSGEKPKDIERCKTRDRPLPGGRGLGEDWSESLPREFAQRHGVTEQLADHLLKSYGCRADFVLEGADAEAKEPICPGLHHIWAEVDFAVSNEMAITLEDAMVRRTLIAMKEARKSLEIAPAVADRMAEKLKWSEGERKGQLERYRSWIENCMEAIG